MNTSNAPSSTTHIVPSVSVPSRHTSWFFAYVSPRGLSTYEEKKEDLFSCSSAEDAPLAVDASASQASAACLSPAVAGFVSSASATARVHAASRGPTPSARRRRRRRVSHWRHSQ